MLSQMSSPTFLEWQHNRDEALQPRPYSSAQGFRSCYLTNLRTKRPPPTSSAPAPSAKSAGAPIPPDCGSALAGAGGAGAGAGAAFGAGGGW